MSQAKVAKTSSPSIKGSIDLLSNLPEDVKLKILEHLPLQDAIRTGILSTHWRYQWAKLPKILFNKEFFSTVIEPRSKKSESMETSESDIYSNIVNNVLSCHIGPLQIFDLYIPECFESNTIVSEWLLFDSLKSLSELYLTVDCEILLTLPSMVFSYTGLIMLQLCGFAIHSLPPTFTGFLNLAILQLLKCEFKSTKVLESLISSCPQLQFLRLENQEGLDLAINSPKLEFLYLQGVFGKLCLGNEITYLETLDMDLLSDSFSSLQFSSLPVIQRLHLGGLCLWRFSKVAWMTDLLRLQSQTLELFGIPVDNAFVTYFSLKLLCYSPPLRKLRCRFSLHDFFEREWKPLDELKETFPGFDNWNFPKLEYVELYEVIGSSSELQFIKTILECAPMLKVIMIDLSSKMQKLKDKWEIALYLMEYTRLSKDAKIIFKNEIIESD